MGPRCLILLLSVLLLAAPAQAREVPRGIVLVTIDTLRADHVGCYGYSRATTPFLDRLAREGVLFERAYASCSMTAPSHASLFTGLYPLQHGVRVNDEGFKSANQRRFRTLAEKLTSAGFDTAAFSGVGFLRSISQGFETVDGGSGNYKKYRQADATIDHVLAWLAKPHKRFFIWVHLFDVHPPRRPPTHGPSRLGFDSKDAAQRFLQDQLERKGVVLSAYPSAEALLDNYEQYDAELLFADSELGRLFDHMQAMHLNEKTLWVVTADHGEGLGNHAWIDHVRYLYEEAIRVPLILYADHQWAGRRVESVVRNVDIAPTLFDFLGLPFDQPGFTVPGRSFRPLLQGEALPSVFAFSVRRTWGTDHPDWEKGEVYSIEDDDWKYIAHSDRKDELFDLRKDPLELENLVDTKTPVGDRLSGRARAMFAAFEREGVSSKTTTDPTVTDELKALGYIQ